MPLGVARQVVHPIAEGGRTVNCLIGETSGLLDPSRLDAQRFGSGRLAGLALSPDLTVLNSDVTVGQPVLGWGSESPGFCRGLNSREKSKRPLRNPGRFSMAGRCEAKEP